ncbi:hypothetical protein [Flavobacterium chungangense]|uniref:hypothetical protein n=1 Tax=Flavobacterium chungangense TaxID=554283 RepID=UPI0004DF86BE|nr:hypothetical protein [Flavobacterium chungangense]
MKKIKIILAVFIAVYSYNHFFTNGMLIGKYVNRNYGDDFIGNIPHIADTLLLKENNQFESPYYGKGTYKLSYGFGGTRIELHYGDDYSSTNIKGEKVSVPNKESFETSINRIWFIGNPQISLFEDLNQYYEKIE